MTAYIKNSLVVDSAEMQQIVACAAANNITVSLGYSENDGNSLYIGQCLITSSGIIKAKRRKLKATHMERTIFGDASGDSLYNVVDTELGRVGHLACWEHIQPLLKFHTISQREEIHISAWPPVYKHQGEELWSMSQEGLSYFISTLFISWLITRLGTQSLSKTYAAESQAFVLHCSAVLTQKGIDRMNLSSGMLMNTPGGGCSAVFGPDGRQLSENLDSQTEGIVYADLNMDDILKVKAFADCCGHYSRPDLLWLGVDAREKKHLMHVKDENSNA